jgi:N-formylglutamate amidohydrolase
MHVPHAGRGIPAAERGRIVLDDEQLAEELRQMTDWHTDRLAHDALARSGVGGVAFVNRRSRLLVDPERFPDDTEPMTALGMGPVYQVTSHLQQLRPPDPDDDRRLLDTWFRPYATAFAALVRETLDVCGRAVIVDVHSYPSRPLPYERDAEAGRPGVCVGTDPFHTPRSLAGAVIAAFDGVQDGVAENTPFTGTYVPLPHWRRTPAVQSVMVEVRRDLYQVEPGGPVHDGYTDLAGRLARLLSRVTADADA